jgi:hypothetical protein
MARLFRDGRKVNMGGLVLPRDECFDVGEAGLLPSDIASTCGAEICLRYETRQQKARHMVGLRFSLGIRLVSPRPAS